MALKAIIFDFDGSIVDTETPDLATWREVFDEHGVTLDHQIWCRFVGRHGGFLEVLDHLELQTGLVIDRDIILERKRARCLEIIHQQTTRPGVEQWLLDAAELSLQCVIASSSSRIWIEGHLERLGLRHHFSSIHCRDDVTQTKPDPEVYLAALKQLGISPREAIAIEDSPHGVSAARAAGIFCIAVPNDGTRPLCFDHADMVLDSLDQATLSALHAQFRSAG
jgi:HAD superfamily hydrolase (TIGR01509 family)